MQKYSVIVFDLGNVLINFDYAPFIDRLNKAEAGLGEKMINLYRENYHIHRAFEAGKMSEADFLSLMMGWCNNKITGEYFCRIFSDIFTENKKVTSLLPLLKKKYMLALLSNTNIIHKKYGWEKYGFLKYFDKLCLSYELGAVKPEKAIYRSVEEITGFSPEKHIFIDDVKEYAEGARNAGWDAIHFTDYDSLLTKFKSRNII